MQQLEPSVPQEVRSHRYPELDALRGLAATTVVLHHLLLLWNSAPWYAPLFTTPIRLLFAGPQAVTLFFVLSGFVLSGPQASPRRAGYARYLVKRLCRIYLPLLAALVIAFAFDRHFYLRSLTANEWLNSTWSYRPTLSQLAQAALTSMPFGQQFNTAFWSVFLEIRISLVFPLLFLLVRRIPTWCTLAVIASLCAGNASGIASDWFIHLQAVCCFLSGVLAFLHLGTLRRWLEHQPRRRQLLLLALALLTYTYARGTIHLNPVSPVSVPVASPLSNVAPATAPAAPTAPVEAAPAPAHLALAILIQIRFLLCVAASLLLMLGAITQPALRRFCRHPLLLRLGALSYSVYLIHGTVLFAATRAWWGRLPTPWFVFVVLALVYAASELFHFLIDAPSLQLGRRLAAPQPAA